MRRYFFLCLLFVSFSLHGVPLVWNSDGESRDIGDQVEIFEDPTGLITFEQIISEKYSSQFTTSNMVNLSLGYTESFFWIKFEVNNLSEKSLFLELAQAGIPSATLYIENNNILKSYEAGYNVPVYNKQVKSAFQVFEIPKGINSCYLRLNSNSEPIPIKLHSANAYDSQSRLQILSYGIYLGLMLFVILNNLFYFITLRQGIRLFYAFIVLLYVSYSAAVIDGYIIYLFPALDLIFLYTTIPALGVTIQTIYCLQFLEVKRYTPGLYKVILGIVAYFGVWLIIKLFFPFSIVQPINTLNALISFFVMGYVGYKTGKNGNRLGYYFAIAYFIYFILVAIQAIYINTGAPEYIGGLSHVAYATLIEVLILSFLLSKRSEWDKRKLEKERFNSNQKLIETIKENERIVQEQNVRLEQKVMKRTVQLNKMNSELQVSNDQLNLSSNEKIIANKLLTEQKMTLEDQHLELEALIHTKDRFLSLISHDLRGPVSSFLSVTSLISMCVDEKDYDDLPEIVNKMDNAVRNLSNLLDNLLNWAINQHGDYSYTPKKLEARRLIQESIELFGIMAKSKGLDLNVEMEDQIFVYCDLNSVLTVFRNLINNAIKFTNKGGEIKIVGSQVDGMLKLNFIDTGIGISKEKIETIFNPKETKSTWGTEGEKGLGLGLQLAYDFVSLNNGKILVESMEGVGTTFTVLLPLNQPGIPI
ncbi:MAG: sensor histidine kinase [Reichenbachiella sp.]